jgi:hypothetical protein
MNSLRRSNDHLVHTASGLLARCFCYCSTTIQYNVDIQVPAFSYTYKYNTYTYSDEVPTDYDYDIVTISYVGQGPSICSWLATVSPPSSPPTLRIYNKTFYQEAGDWELTLPDNVVFWTSEPFSYPDGRWPAPWLYKLRLKSSPNLYSRANSTNFDCQGVNAVQLTELYPYAYFQLDYMYSTDNGLSWRGWYSSTTKTYADFTLNSVTSSVTVSPVIL